MSEPEKDVEVELKLALVDPERFDALLAALPTPSRVIEQRNHYLTDPDGTLTKGRVMLRVRERWEVVDAERRLIDAVMTAKRKRSDAHGIFVADEHEHAVELKAWRAFTAGEGTMEGLEGAALAWVRGEVGLKALAVQGAMTNRRHVVPWAGLTLEVDRTEYPDGTVDAEIEVETDDPEAARGLLDRLAHDAEVALTPQSLTKYERFLARGGAPS